MAAFALASCGGGDSNAGAGTAGAPAACYATLPAGAQSFNWPGGVGPERPEAHNNSSCSAPSGTVVDLVVAVNEAQALDRCPDRADSSASVIETAPAVDAPAGFFLCEP